MELISLAESLRIVAEFCGRLQSQSETIVSRSARDRVLSDTVFAKQSNPPEAVAAMDGIALDFRAAMNPPSRLKAEKWQRVNTGERVQPPFNSVVKIEDITWDGETPIVSQAVQYAQHVRRPGEDFEDGALLFLPGHALRPQDISLLVASGNEEVAVRKKPVITFIPTGSELVANPGDAIGGKVIESNSAMIRGLVETWGGEFRSTNPVPDDPDDLAQMLKMALKGTDLILISAGTSMGTRDNTAGVLAVMGKIAFHGVDVSPAKPVLFAEVETVPVLGLPGYPAAAFVASQLYLRPLVCAYSGINMTAPQSVFVSAEDLPARKSDTFYRVNVFEVDEQTYVRRIPKGAGSIRSVTEMDGLLHVPPDTAIRRRDGVRIDLLREPKPKVFAGGGISDPKIDEYLDRFRRLVPDYRLLYWETPAEDALQNIIERNAHFAIISTPDSGPDLYPQFEKQLQEPMRRIRLFPRQVGLTVATDLKELPKPVDVALPRRNTRLWEQVIVEQKWNLSDFQTILVDAEEQVLPAALQNGQWKAVFADVRFLTDEQNPIATTKEYVDLVASEYLLTSTPLAKLVQA